MECTHNNRALGFGLVANDQLIQCKNERAAGELASERLHDWPVLVSPGDCQTCAIEQWRRQNDALGLFRYNKQMELMR